MPPNHFIARRVLKRLFNITKKDTHSPPLPPPPPEKKKLQVGCRTVGTDAPVRTHEFAHDVCVFVKLYLFLLKNNLMKYRKPKVTRRVVEEEEPEADTTVDMNEFFNMEEERAQLEEQYDDSTGVNGTDQSGSRAATPSTAATSPDPGTSSQYVEDTVNVDEDGNYILPEGTVLLLQYTKYTDKNSMIYVKIGIE